MNRVDYKKINRALSFVVLGYCVLQMGEHWHISLIEDEEYFKYIPWWISSTLFFTAVSKLGKFNPDMKLLKPLCVIMGFIDLTEWVVSVFEIEIPFEAYILKFISSVIVLYFNYQLLTNISQIAEKCGYDTIKGMLLLRDIRTVYVTIYMLLLPFADILKASYWYSWIGWFTIILIRNSLNSFECYLLELEKSEKK